MNIELITTFLAIIRNQSFSATATELNIAQTTVSQRIKVLEQETGLKLLERGKGIKYISLTPAGDEFYELAKQWLHIAHEIQNLKNREEKPSLTIGSIDSFNTFVLPNVYKNLRSSSPPVSIHVQTLHSDEIYIEIEKRNIDIGFSLKKRIHANVNVTECFRSPMVVIRPNLSSYTCDAELTPTNLDPNYELFMPWGQEYQIWHDYWWNPLSAQNIKVDDANLLLALLNGEKQWAIVPEFIAKIALTKSDYCIHRLDHPPPDFVCYVLTHKKPINFKKNTLEIFKKLLQNRLISIA